MIESGLATLAFGLAASASWGVSDFTGALATRRGSVIAVLAVAHLVGFLLFLALAILTGEPFPAAGDMIWGMLAGLCGAVGLLALYQGLAVGRMGIVAPVSSVVSSVLPVLFGAATEGLPTILQLIGIIIGIVSVVMVSYSRDQNAHQPSGLRLALLAGLGLTGLTIFMDRISPGALCWPLVGTRLVSSALGFAIVWQTGRALPSANPSMAYLILICGALDAAGNAFFLLSVQAGQLAIAAVVSSMYPAITVLLARVILKERISVLQMIGIGTALAAIAFIAAG